MQGFLTPKGGMRVDGLVDLGEGVEQARYLSDADEGFAENGLEADDFSLAGVGFEGHFLLLSRLARP